MKPLQHIVHKAKILRPMFHCGKQWITPLALLEISFLVVIYLEEHPSR
jgi:hypothetical protein